LFSELLDSLNSFTIMGGWFCDFLGWVLLGGCLAVGSHVVAVGFGVHISGRVGIRFFAYPLASSIRLALTVRLPLTIAWALLRRGT
jgi:hypothetical protein